MPQAKPDEDENVVLARALEDSEREPGFWIRLLFLCTAVLVTSLPGCELSFPPPMARPYIWLVSFSDLWVTVRGLEHTGVVAVTAAGSAVIIMFSYHSVAFWVNES